MPTKKENRDYQHELELRKQRGSKHYGFALKSNEVEQYEAMLELHQCKTTLSLIRKLLTGELAIIERD